MRQEVANACRHKLVFVLFVAFFILLMVYGVLSGDLTQMRLEGGTL